MAISSADIVYCNHGINDCQLSPTPTPPETYRDLLMQFVTICRKYGKIPVLQTPSPIYAGVGVLGTADKANRLKTYVTIMRDVAEVTNTQLVDVYAVISAYIHTGKYTVQELVKDGIHPTVITYRAMAFEMARPIIHPHAGINGPDQFISTIEGTTNTYPPTAPQLAAAARTGYHLTTDAIDQPKSIKVAVHISVPHLDVFIAYPIWSSGKNGINIAWDGEAIVGINQFSTLAIGVGEFVYDHEICIARDVPVGMHMLTLASGGQAFAIGLSYLRTRPSKPAKKFGPARDLWRDKAYSLMTLSGTGADSTLLMDELPHSRALDAEGTDITFTATMAKDTQFVLHGILTATGAASALSPRMGIGVGLQVGTGFCTVYQNPNAGVYTTSVLGAVDLSGTARTWRLFRPAGSANLTVYMNGVSQGTVALTGPHVGGFMGLRANGAGLAVTVQDLRDIEH
ncbi:SGNH/GDSL hydrolase family protein [Mesorhizobium kowhaii]|uniref:SGNH/GDSL hydrolase family protein n=1 Tax=Mesorhizobium kowhaii TaxID=1300272 RepID=UPI0035E8E716